MESLILYIGSFLISTSFAYAVQSIYRNIKNIRLGTKVAVSFLIMIVPIIISSLRTDIGVDYETYYKIFSRVHDSSIDDYPIASGGTFEFFNKPIIDIGVLVFGNISGVFAIYAILTLTIYEMALLNFRKTISLPIGTLLILLILYSASLNIVRQSLAIAIVFYSIKYILAKKLLRYLLLIGVATFIHSSAIIALFFYFLYFPKENIRTKIIQFSIVITPILVVTSLSLLSDFILFERYFEVYEQEKIDISKSYIIKLPVLFLLAISYPQLKKTRITKFLFLLVLMELILLFSASIFKWAFRLSYYPYIGQIILLSMASKDGVRNASIIKFASVLWYISYFYVLFYMWGRDGIFPYKHI